MYDDSENMTMSGEAKLSSLVKSGKAAAIILFVIAGAFTVLAITATAQFIIGAVGFFGSPDEGEPIRLSSIISLIPGYVIAVTLFVASFIFKDISHGESPFTDKQVRRIRLISLLLFAYAVFDSFVPRGVLVNGGQIGAAPGLVHSQTSSEYYGVNIGLFVTAMVFYLLSLVFKYGIELQQLSDDTL